MVSDFNLVDDKWIPIAAAGRVSLSDVFSDSSLIELDGNPIQKIAVLKLLIAIAYASVDIPDEAAWKRIGPSGLAKAALEYVGKHRDCFFLYGQRPFLQLPAIKNLEGAKASRIFFDYIPDLASDNDSILRELQAERELGDGEKAVFIVTLMNYALAGKRIMKTPPLSPEAERVKSAKAGPSIGGTDGLLQTCFLGSNLQETIWLNMITADNVKEFRSVSSIKTLPPWERMPEGESDEIAAELKSSVYSWLVSLSRFVMLEEDGILYASGIQYPSVKDGYIEPFITVNIDKLKGLQANSRQKPWRELPALLQSVYEKGKDKWTCPIISMNFNRTKSAVSEFGIWVGGLKASANSGDQSVKRSDDYIESAVFISSDMADSSFYDLLCLMIKQLSEYEQILQHAVSGYFVSMGMDKSAARQSSELAASDFWQFADSKEDEVIVICEEGNKDKIKSFLNVIWRNLIWIYERKCIAVSARQIKSFAANYPRRKNEIF